MKRLHWFSNKRWLHKVDSALAMKAEWLPTQALLTVMNLLTLFTFPFTGIRASISWVVKISHIHLARIPFNHLGLWWWTFSPWVWEDFTDVFRVYCTIVPIIFLFRDGEGKELWCWIIYFKANTTSSWEISFWSKVLENISSRKVIFFTSLPTTINVYTLRLRLRGQQDLGRVGSTR